MKRTALGRSRKQGGRWRKAAGIALVTVLAIGVLPAISSAAGAPWNLAGTTVSQSAQARAATNTGNPYENGDFYWDGNTQAWRIAGIDISVWDIQPNGTGSYSGPFPYPESLKKAYALFQQSAGGGNFPGWGASKFIFRSVLMEGNSRGIMFNNDLPTTGQCAQRGQQLTAYGAIRPARLILVEEESWWAPDGSVFHGTFAMLVDNGHAAGVWDQAPMGDHYVYADWYVNGKISIDKDSMNTGITDGNALYSLAGAEYGIFATRDDASARRNPLATLVTDGNGIAESGELAVSTYYVRETKQAPGYALDEQIYETVVIAGETVPVNGGKVHDVPQSNPLGIVVGKHDGERAYAEADNTPQGSATLADAHFTVRYYDGHYGSAQDAEASGGPTRTWVFRTDDTGTCLLGEASKVSGDDLFANSAGAPTFPLGTYLIQETKAPEGYQLPDPAPVMLRSITEQGLVETVQAYTAPAVPDPIVRGGVLIQKADAETGGPSVNGSDLSGATFRIANESAREVLIDGTPVAPGGTIADIVTDGEGIARTATDLLPYGKYSATEIDAPEGYLGTDRKVEFSIEENGRMVELRGDAGFANRSIRGDLEFQKKRESDGTLLASIPFRLTNETTGESHVIVTDENGYASTAANWNPHSIRTNANDDAADGSYDAAAGIWFGEVAGAKPRDDLGALPYGTYTLEELPCATNADLQLICQEGISITRDTVEIELGTINDPEMGTVRIGTSASDAHDGDKAVVAGTNAAVVDRVFYMGLEPGQAYELHGSLMLVDGGQAFELGGSPVETSVEFVAQEENGTIDVRFDLGATANALPQEAEVRVAVFEELRLDGRPIAEHKALDDSGQQVRIVVPTLSTEAACGLDGGKTVPCDPQVPITDTVTYRNLEAGASYRMVSAAVPRELAAGTDPSALDAALATAEQKFVAESGWGELGVTLECDTSPLDDGEEIVLFQWVYDSQGNLAALHADPDDAQQTVTVKHPAIGTAAADAADSDKTILDDGSRNAVLIDTVSYEGLVPGRAYRLEGALMLKATGEPLLDGQGDPVTASIEFTPALATGTAQMEFSFDPTTIPQGGEVVAFEKLLRGGIELAAHADIEDAGQTVSIDRPRISTSAADAADDDRQAAIDPEAAVTDQVSIENAIAGTQYLMAGILMDAGTGLPFLQGEPQETDGEDLAAWWEAVKEALGNPNAGTATPFDREAFDRLMQGGIAERLVTATREFGLPDSWGSVDLAFGPFDASQLDEGDSLVAFEALINPNGDVVVATHADLDDRKQTVALARPSIETEAHDAADGDRTVVAGTDARIVDTVSYRGLVPGKPYEIHGTLMSKTTGVPLTGNDGRPIIGTAAFTPESPEDKVQVEFRFDATELEEGDAVVFEKLLRDGAEIAAHEDLNDPAQTVTIEAPPEGEPFDRTGRTLLPAFAALAGLGCLGAALAIGGMRPRR